MNKRYIYIGVIVLFLIAVCVWEQVSIAKYLGEMQAKVQSLIEFVKEMDDVNTTEIFDKVVEIEKEWKTYESTLCYMVNLKDIEDLGIELTKMKVFVVENNLAEFKASLSLLLFYIDSYYNLMGISFENVF